MTRQHIQLPALQADSAIRLAHETLDIEAAAIQGLKERIGNAFVHAVEMMLAVRGRVVVMGSKNVPAPGPGASAYSASKAAWHDQTRRSCAGHFQQW